ncbi:conjugal transfer protein [Lysinibacillus alkalisoli]|uniref:Conjugal transfer protein n=1 Tax=Lysinibacillus alkalisoli TaxID=1911548 RepID=A0A917LJD9_9BACI|nr:TrsD/TraD family conjugative transfer protein [Lysinibacillus alkalisoli]GGG33782.1 conjugal transfer protein [Lysinibacillus alkalisoli]
MKKWFSKKQQEDFYSFDFTPTPLAKGQSSLQEMSLIQAQYQDYFVTKRGYLVALIQTSGINLDLLTTTEQADAFDEYNAFLMATLGDVDGEVHQYLDITMPVYLQEYILFWQQRYLQEQEKPTPNEAKLSLLASYIDYYSTLASTSEMTTKQHIVVLHTKIAKRTYPALEQAAHQLEEKVSSFIRQLEAALVTYDMTANQLTARESRAILQHLLNFSQH